MGDVGGAGCEVELEVLLVLWNQMLTCNEMDCTYETSILQAGLDLFGDML